MSPLSRTEERLIALHYEGFTYKEVEQLHAVDPLIPASLNTIKTHYRRIVAKTHARSLRHAVYLWRESQTRARQMELSI